MDVWNSGGRQMARTFDELVRLRACLRPGSVEEEPSFQPVEEIDLPDETFLHITPNVEQMSGWTPAYLKKISSCGFLVHPEDLEVIYPHWYRVLMGHTIRGIEIRWAHADGNGYIWTVSDLRPRLRYPDGRVRDVHSRTYDITALRARELDFVISCLRQFHPRRDRDVLEALDIPSLISTLLPHRRTGNGATVLQFRRSNGTRRPEAHTIRRLQPDISYHPR